MNMGIAIIILGLFIVLLVVVIYKLGRIIEAKEHQIKAIKAVIEKQGEQNYEFHGIAESRPAKGELNKLCQELSQSKDTKISDQEWSEEDERLCQCLIRVQEKALDEVRNDKYGHSEIISDLKEMYRERIDWLESLKQRLQ